jgi:hypothetical protein
MAKGKRRLGNGSGGWRQTVPIVPLALFAGAFTIQASTDDPAVANAALDGSAAGVPGSVVVPSTPINDQVNLPVPGVVAPGVPRDAQPTQVVSGLSRNGIPQAALKAYSRAQQVLAQADPGCNLPWTLVAAIGRVESNHGRHGGNVLNADGVATPGIYGPRLDGSNTARITDTDNGVYDGDTAFDRAVGPMQFIPGTWNAMAVDGDGDGTRNPQDIDDAAMSAGVYLCSGHTNLADPADLNQAVLRYNHSQSYVDLVIKIAQAYARGSWIAVDNGKPEDADQGIDRNTNTSRTSLVAPTDPMRTQQPSQTRPTTRPTSDPSQTTKPTTDPTQTSTQKPTQPTTSTSTPPPTSTTTAPSSVTTTVTELTKATQYCQTKLEAAITDPTSYQLQKCVDAYLAGGTAAADAVIRDLLALLGTIGVLGGGILGN